MFGLVDKDFQFTNLKIDAQTTAGKLSASNIVGQVYPSTPIGPYSVINIDTFDNTINPVSYTLSLDSSNLNVGDMVMVLFKVAQPDGNDVIINLPSNIYFSYSFITNTTSFNIKEYPYFNIPLLFNGSIFVSTFEFY